MPAVISMETGLNLSRTPRRCGVLKAVKQAKVTPADLGAPLFSVPLHAGHSAGVARVATEVLRVCLPRAGSKVGRAIVASHTVFMIYFVRPAAVAQRHQDPMRLDGAIKKRAPQISVRAKAGERRPSSPTAVPNRALVFRRLSSVLKHVRRPLSPEKKAGIQVKIEVFPQFCGCADLIHVYRSLRVPNQHMQSGQGS